MTKKRGRKTSEATEFLKRNRLTNHGGVTWIDESKNRFDLAITRYGLKKHGTPFDYITAQILKKFPQRKREEIKEIWFESEFWVIEKGRLSETVILPF